MAQSHKEKPNKCRINRQVSKKCLIMGQRVNKLARGYQEQVLNQIKDYIIQKQRKSSMNSTAVIGIQYARTECDSSQEIQYEPMFSKTNPLKHKTELCKTFSQLGYCNYGDKCRFAHGRHELVQLPVNQQLRKRRCNGYWGKGYCSYGVRCQFGHGDEKPEDALILQVAKGIVKGDPNQQPKLFKVLQSE